MATVLFPDHKLFSISAGWGEFSWGSSGGHDFMANETSGRVSRFATESHPMNNNTELRKKNDARRVFLENLTLI